MTNLKDINSLFKTANSNWGSRIFAIFILVILIVAGFFLRQVVAKPKPVTMYEDCSYYKEQNKVLINKILGIEKEVEAVGLSTSFTPGKDYISFAVYDTTKKPLTRQQVQQSMKKIVTNIDVFLDSLRMADSIKMIKRKQ